MAFNLKKEEIRRRMQSLMQELDHKRNTANANTAKPEHAADGKVDGNPNMPSWLEPLSTRSSSGTSAVDESGAAIATSGTTLQIKIRRPTRTSLGFRVVGGVDRAYGGVFIAKISSSTATELKVSNTPNIHGRFPPAKNINLFFSSYSTAVDVPMSRGMRGVASWGYSRRRATVC